ncbi:uncharacterized protein LOC143292268 [Babylonia areolata]|uniref:uncharacterized protein LOC143292268 n=1 Tax=Babylonia areolata TaxID=304850 RepID=UPI003FD10563
MAYILQHKMSLLGNSYSDMFIKKALSVKISHILEEVRKDMHRLGSRKRDVAAFGNSLQNMDVMQSIRPVELELVLAIIETHRKIRNKLRKQMKIVDTVEESSESSATSRSPDLRGVKRVRFLEEHADQCTISAHLQPTQPKAVESTISPSITSACLPSTQPAESVVPSVSPDEIPTCVPTTRPKSAETLVSPGAMSTHMPLTQPKAVESSVSPSITSTCLPSTQPAESVVPSISPDEIPTCVPTTRPKSAETLVSPGAMSTHLPLTHPKAVESSQPGRVQYAVPVPPSALFTRQVSRPQITDTQTVGDTDVVPKEIDKEHMKTDVRQSLDTAPALSAVQRKERPASSLQRSSQGPGSVFPSSREGKQSFIRALHPLISPLHPQPFIRTQTDKDCGKVLKPSSTQAHHAYPDMHKGVATDKPQQVLTSPVPLTTEPGGMVTSPVTPAANATEWPAHGHTSPPLLLLSETATSVPAAEGSIACQLRYAGIHNAAKGRLSALDIADLKEYLSVLPSGTRAELKEKQPRPHTADRLSTQCRLLPKRQMGLPAPSASQSQTAVKQVLNWVHRDNVCPPSKTYQPPAKGSLGQKRKSQSR